MTRLYVTPDGHLARDTRCRAMLRLDMPPTYTEACRLGDFHQGRGARAVAVSGRRGQVTCLACRALTPAGPGDPVDLLDTLALAVAS